MNYFSIAYKLVTLQFYLILCDVVVSQSQVKHSSTDLLITVKTTGNNHWTRLIDLIDTWYQFAPQNTYFVTDTDDEAISRKTHGHLLNSGCGVGHDVSSLCCKMGFEVRIAVKNRAKWWCHFDDDNYVNVLQLRSLLNGLNSRRDYYLGKISTSNPVAITQLNADGDKNLSEFWFGTGGAGICLSQSTLQKLHPYVKGKRFERLCHTAGSIPDDVTLGYVITQLLNVELTSIDRLHSHLEDLRQLDIRELPNQISLSSRGNNRIAVPEVYSKNQDYTSFRSLHCYLFPYLCKNVS
ncbi:fringe-like domain-containing protein [Ditylenchus destructor]|nr:fringe-like domain-containing protein [Ditylenchus destructor]